MEQAKRVKFNKGNNEKKLKLITQMNRISFIGNNEKKLKHSYCNVIGVDTQYCNNEKKLKRNITATIYQIIVVTPKRNYPMGLYVGVSWLEM